MRSPNAGSAAKTGKKPLTRIAAAIYCERDGQKAILIGKGGSKLKEIGTGAREQDRVAAGHAGLSRTARDCRAGLARIEGFHGVARLARISWNGSRKSNLAKRRSHKEGRLARGYLPPSSIVSTLWCFASSCAQRGVFFIVIGLRRSQQCVLQCVGMEAANLLIVPFLFAGRIGHQEVDGSANGTAIGGFEVPKIDADFIAECRQLAQPVKTPIAVAPGVGAREFQRLLRQARSARRCAVSSRAPASLWRAAVAEEERNRCHLQVVPVAVIVLRRVFSHCHSCWCASSGDTA